MEDTLEIIRNFELDIDRLTKQLTNDDTIFEVILHDGHNIVVVCETDEERMSYVNITVTLLRNYVTRLITNELVPFGYSYDANKRELIKL